MVLAIVLSLTQLVVAQNTSCPQEFVDRNEIINHEWRIVRDGIDRW